MKEVIIVIDRAAVMEDVRRRLWLAGRSAGAATEWKAPEAIAYMQGGGDETEDARVDGILRGDVAYLRGRLAEWIMAGTSEWILRMRLPDNYSRAGVEAAQKLLPDALGSRAAAEWLAMTAGTACAEIAKVWASEGAAKLNEGIAMMYEREMPEGRIKES